MASVGLADRVFLLSESNRSPQHVSCLAVFEIPRGAPATFVADLADQMAAVLEFAVPFNLRLAHPALKSVAPSFVPVAADEIDLEFHFRRSALPTPGGERELGVLVSRLHSRGLDLTKPLWECHLIEGLEGDRFALFFKAHHALIDGVGAMRKLQEMFSADPDDRTVRPIWTIGPSARRASKSTKPTEPNKRRTRAKQTFAEVRALGRATATLTRERTTGAPDPAMATPYRIPKTRMNGKLGQQRRVATQTVDFQRVRDLADRVDASVNDIFLAVTGGALRQYLAETGDLPEKSLIAGTPVSIRVGEGDDATNAFTIVTMNLGTDIADGVERIRAVKVSGSLAKGRMAGLTKAGATNYGVLVTLPHVLQNVVGLGGRLTPPYNVLVSNVPGPLDPQYMAGASLERLTPFGLVSHGVGLTITAVTASGKMSVGLVGDRDSLPHLQHLAVYMAEELDRLEKAVAHTEPQRRRSRSAPKS